MKGTVTRSTGSWFTVKNEAGEHIECRIKGRFRIKGIRSTNPVAVGDRVNFEMEDEEFGTIDSIEPRKNYIIRKATKLSKEVHILAANLDLAIVVSSIAHPSPKAGFIDRFLATAEAYSIPGVVIFNKLDLLSEKSVDKVSRLHAIYEDMGYPVLPVSAQSGEGLEDLKALLKGKTSIISGQSGVGKSSLVNAIEPGLGVKVSDVSESNEKGRHTTTFAEMFDLSFGGHIIDTPGIRSFGLVEMEKHELFHFFKEIFETAQDCRFNNCVHINEPGCAVKAAVEEGEIAYSRYESYYNLYFDKDD